MQAYCLVREQPWYRREAFARGLKAAGYNVEFRHPPMTIARDTVLLIWNRYAEQHAVALRVESAGGRVLVAENGYIGQGGGTPKFQVHPAGPQPGHYYALSEGWHNGKGKWPQGDGERWKCLGVEIKPWRTGGKYSLVCPNRSFGVGNMLMHPDWPERTAARLRKMGLEVRVRPHPGNDAPKRPLTEDLAGASVVYIWSSSAGVHALAEGIPVFCEAPHWIMKGAAGDPAFVRPGRLEHFERLAWAQWTCAEIEAGVPFKAFLETWKK